MNSKSVCAGLPASVILGNVLSSMSETKQVKRPFAISDKLERYIQQREQMCRRQGASHQALRAYQKEVDRLEALARGERRR